MKKNVLYISPMQARALALEAANVTSARFDSQKLLESGRPASTSWSSPPRRCTTPATSTP